MTTTQHVLYDATLGGTPDTQGLLNFHYSPDAKATQEFVDGVTVLDTRHHQVDAAGYMLRPSFYAELRDVARYHLEFDVQVIDETHSDSDKDGDGRGDRAGFSVIVLNNGRRGIELGFWMDRIWAQEDGAKEPPYGTLFTQAEGVDFDSASGLTRYTLVVDDERYALTSAGQEVLSGRLRDYTTFEGPVNPYRTPSFIFLGDDTGSAQALIRLAYVALFVEHHT